MLQPGWTLKHYAGWWSQTQKATYCSNPCLWDVQNRELVKDRKRRVVVSGWKEWRVTVRGTVSLRAMRPLWNHMLVTAAQRCECTKNHWMTHYKRVKLTVCELHLNKDFFFKRGISFASQMQPIFLRNYYVPCMVLVTKFTVKKQRSSFLGFISQRQRQNCVYTNSPTQSWRPWDEDPNSVIGMEMGPPLLRTGRQHGKLKKVRTFYPAISFLELFPSNHSYTL